MAKPVRQSGMWQDLFGELRRRRVLRTAAMYLAAGWIVIEVSSTVMPPLNLPPWSVTLVIVLVGLGFPIVVILAWMFDIGSKGIERTEDEAAGTSRKTSTNDDAVAQVLREPATFDKDGRRAIAVLPFVNLSGDPDNEYFSDGIAEEILNLLCKLPQLRVASRTSTFFFKGKQIDLPMVAGKLGVGTLLEGSVRRVVDRVRITAQLIDVVADAHLWSETYDRELKDVFAIQDDIATSIVDALKVTLTPKERRAIQYVATSSPQAYDFYLRGRRYFYAMTGRGFRHAIEMYEHAIESDPKYAAAWAGMADAYSELYRYADASPENAAKCLDASRHAVQLDPDSAEAHTSRGIALSIDKQDAEAERHFETAILLNPNLFDGYFLYGRYCGTRANWEKAARLYIQASEVDSDNYNPPVNLAMACNAMGRFDDEAQARQQAMQTIERRLQLVPDDARARYFGAICLASQGRREKALQWADMALLPGEEEGNVVYNIACVHALLDDRERAMELLEKAVALGWGDRAWLETDSDLACLRDSPRFEALLKIMR